MFPQGSLVRYEMIAFSHPLKLSNKKIAARS